MSPDVVRRKLSAIADYLKDLRRHEGITFEAFMERHYEVERILELLIMNASDIIMHLLSSRGEAPSATYRAAFLRAGEIGIISEELSRNLSLSAGLRNILAHEYDQIDYSVIHNSIPAALRDFTRLIDELGKEDIDS
jgi:uncharacterized protein YutE (UPF0331/DUF86 family)